MEYRFPILNYHFNFSRKQWSHLCGIPTENYCVKRKFVEVRNINNITELNRIYLTPQMIWHSNITIWEHSFLKRKYHAHTLRLQENCDFSSHFAQILKIYHNNYHYHEESKIMFINDLPFFLQTNSDDKAIWVSLD